MADAAPRSQDVDARTRRDAALDALYRQYWRELVRHVTRSFGPGPPDPEDAAQAAFTHFASLDDLSVVDTPRAFLYRSARNYVLDQKRRLKVRVRFANSPDAQRVSPGEDELHAERVLDAKERLAIIETTIRAMNPRLRQVFIMHRIHELSYAEIARQLGLSQTFTKKLVARALLACERALEAAEKKGGAS